MNDAVRIDRGYLTDVLVRLARTPTDVPLGQTELSPDHPKLTHYVRAVLLPEFERLGYRPRVVDDWNLAVIDIGPTGVTPALLLMVYTTAQHGNYTDVSMEGQLLDGERFGLRGEVVVGKGTSQCKGATAAVLAALKAPRATGRVLRRGLVVAVNTEGRSSHSCSARIIDDHGVRAAQGIVCIGTGNEIVLGNRGRVDIRVTVKGKSAHSSQPHLGLNAIDGANEVMNRLKTLRFPRTHPYLGAEQMTIYQLICSPIAPHTMPDHCQLTVDRRLLPGTEVAEAVEGVRQVLAGIAAYEVTVEPGAWMLPADVPADVPVVRALDRGHQRATGRSPEKLHVKYTFDAGYANYRGIPTVMFGPSAPGRTRGLGADVTATEFVPLQAVEEAAATYALAIEELCGEGSG